MLKIMVALLCLVTPVFAQTPSPQQQALAQKLMEEINSNIQLRAENIQLSEQIKQLQKDKKDIPEK